MGTLMEALVARNVRNIELRNLGHASTRSWFRARLPVGAALGVGTFLRAHCKVPKPN